MRRRHCSETSLGRDGTTRTCVVEADHEGVHKDHYGRTWEPPKVVLDRLQKEWGHTHRIAWTGSYWVATAHDRRQVRDRTEIEPTPEQLERELRKHTGPPLIPAQRRPR